MSGERLKGINGEYDSSITIPVGILLTPVGSDNETFTDYSTSSGDIIRIPMQKSSDGEITINGRDVRDVFDGTFFAGWYEYKPDYYSCGYGCLLCFSRDEGW